MQRSADTRFPSQQSSAQSRDPNASCHAVAARGSCHRSDHHSPNMKSVLSPKADRTARNFRRPGGHRHRERAACSRNSGAQRRIARGAGASDGDGRGAGIISRSPTDVQPVLDAIVESAARVCGIDDVVIATPRGRILWFVAWLILVLYPYALHARPAVSMSHSIAGCASMARSTFPTSERAERFPDVRLRQRAARTYLVAPLRQQGELIGATDALAPRCAPSPGADQAARDFRRPSRDRHRERPAVPRTQGSRLGTADGDE